MAIGTLTVKDGTSTAKTLEVHKDAAGNLIPVHSLDHGKPTYRASALAVGPTLTGAVTLITIQGSATKTVRVKRITVGGVATASASVVFGLIRTSALGAGGTAVTPTVAKHDSAHGAATAVVSHYTTTLKAAGTPNGGPLASRRLQLAATGTIPTYQTTFFPGEFELPGQSLVLRGTGDFLEVQNLNAGNLGAGTVLDYVVEFEEDDS